MASKGDKIFVGSRGFVAALDARSGEGIWRTRFPSGTPSGMVTMLLKGGRLYMGYSDRAYCLDAGTGSILWTKEAAREEQPVQLAMEGATECVSDAGVAALAVTEDDDRVSHVDDDGPHHRSHIRMRE